MDQTRLVTTINGEKFDYYDIMQFSDGDAVGNLTVSPNFNIVAQCWELTNNSEFWKELCYDNPAFLYPLDIETAIGESLSYRSF